MAVTYTYPGVGTAGSHPYESRLEHGSQEPLTLTNPLNAAQGPGLYSDNMWYKLEDLKDIAIQFALLEKFRVDSIYRPLVPTQIAMRGVNGSISEFMDFKGVYAMEPNYSEVGRRQIWFASNYTDTFGKRITFSDYADKVALHEYDDAVQAYLFRGQAGMINMARTLLGESMTIALDLLARNAFLEGPRFHTIANGVISHGSTSGFPQFTGILNTDVFDLDLGMQVWMDLSYEDIPFAANPNGVQGTLFSITTPSAIFDVQQAADNDWREANLYGNPGLLMKYEVGMWKNTRFINSRRNVLWNCGDVIHRGVLQESYGPGDGGAPHSTLVDKIYKVGQASGVQNWIEVDDASGFDVNDIVTIHETVTDDFGVSAPDGVDYREATARVRRIVAINGNEITFDKPLFKEFLAGSFVTKGVHIHATLYIGGPSVVNGVADPIMAYPMPPIDDARAIYRFIWKGRFKYQLFTPEFHHIIFHGGTAPRWGTGTAM